MSEAFCGLCGEIHSGPVNDQCRASRLMGSRRSMCSAAQDSCEESIGPKLVPIKQEETPPLLIASGAADTDAEDETIREGMQSLEKKKWRAELLRHQKELEDEVRSSAINVAKGRWSRSRSSACEMTDDTTFE